MTTEVERKVWRFRYHLTLTEPPNENALQAAKERLRAIADELTLENFGEEKDDAQ